MLLSTFEPSIAKNLILANPTLSPTLRNRIVSFPPEKLIPIIRQGEMQVQAATGTAPNVTQNPGAMQAVTSIVANLIAADPDAKWGTTDALNPISNLRRRASQPTRFLPAFATLSAAGAGTLTWEPQEGFDGYRVCVPSGQAGLPCELSNFVVGDQLMLTQSGNIGAELLNEQSDLGRIDLPHMDVGVTASMQVTGGVASKDIGAVIVGWGSIPRVLPPGSQVLYQRWEPMTAVNVPAGGTATITLTPQRNIVLRRIGLDYGPTQTGVLGSLYVQQIYVQDRPQLEGSVNLPVKLFNEMGVDEWLDTDMCQLGGDIAIMLVNTDGVNAIEVEGLAVVDVVRLAGQAR